MEIVLLRTSPTIPAMNPMTPKSITRRESGQATPHRRCSLIDTLKRLK